MVSISVLLNGSENCSKNRQPKESPSGMALRFTVSVFGQIVILEFLELELVLKV